MDALISSKPPARFGSFSKISSPSVILLNDRHRVGGLTAEACRTRELSAVKIHLVTIGVSKFPQ